MVKSNVQLCITLALDLMQIQQKTTVHIIRCKNRVIAWGGQ